MRLSTPKLVTKLKTVVDSTGPFARPNIVRIEIDRQPQKPIVYLSQV